MFSLVQLLSVAGTIGLAIFLFYLFNYVWRMERKYDLLCFLFGDGIFIIFFLFLFFSKSEQVPSLLSSLVIAELTLALVWVELSKRPELKLLSFVPIVHDRQTIQSYRADYHGELSEPSRFLQVREASYPNDENLKFDDRFSFSVDLSNIGYDEVVVHEYIVYLDGKRLRTTALTSKSNPLERLVLKTQQRHTIDVLPLFIESSGFHKIRIKVLATTIECSKEIWFYISEDFKKLRYFEMYPLKRLLLWF